MFQFRSLQGEDYSFSNVTLDIEDEFFWFGLVYNSWLGVVTLYIDGDVSSRDFLFCYLCFILSAPYKLPWQVFEVRYIGIYDTVTISNPEIKNTRGINSLQCYQLYNQALSLKEFVFTRDACIVYRKLPLLTWALSFSLSLSFLFLLYLSLMTAHITYPYSFLSSTPILLRPSSHPLLSFSTLLFFPLTPPSVVFLECCISKVS